MHGGLSTGPRTPEGRERCRTANWRHGLRSHQYEEERREIRAMIHEARQFLAGL
jgi:hypothetical protein